MSYNNIVPYTSVFIDATWKEFLKSVHWCLVPPKNHDQLVADIEHLFLSKSNANPVLPCLSVRTGLDLFLAVSRFPPGSEVIMSAINIPAMVTIIHSHGLEVVALDVDIKTMRPKLELLEHLVTSRTRVLLLSNIFGRGFDIDPFLKVAKTHGLVVIEDWAEGFSGFDYLGHRESDLSLFSFGPIKYYTAFGGAVAKIKDINVYYRMKNLYDTYHRQSHYDYLTKIVKLFIVYVLLNCPRVVKPAIYITNKFSIDHKKRVVNLLRGFPNEMLKRIRYRPCAALLATLKMRLSQFSFDEFYQSNIKAEYALSNLPQLVMPVGQEAAVRNHWLFPILAKNPSKMIEALSTLGIHAYQGTTQLNIVESDRPPHHVDPFHKQAKTLDGNNTTFQSKDNYVEDSTNAEKNGSPADRLEKEYFVEFLHQANSNTKLHEGLSPIYSNYHSLPPTVPGASTEAEFLINHVIYLPINKTIPFKEIDKICKALSQILNEDECFTTGKSLKPETNGSLELDNWPISSSDVDTTLKTNELLRSRLKSKL